MSFFVNHTFSLGESGNGKPDQQCPGLAVQNAVLGTSCFLGIIANSIILAFIFKNRRGGLTPDKILITNFALVDLIACLISLPLHMTAINGDSRLADNGVCLARFFTMFASFAVNIMTLAAISIDRYDAICRAPFREITLRKTVYHLVFIWLFAICTAAAGGSGHVLTAARSEHVCLSPGREIPSEALTGKSVMLAIVTLWIVPSLAIVFYRFYAIVKYVQEHSAHLRSVLGAVGVKREVKLTRICAAMVVTYLSCWVMFAIMVLLRNMFSSLTVHCTYLWSHSLAYSSFTVVPFEYMVLDKRLLAYVWQKFSRKRRKISAAEDMSNRKVMYTKKAFQNQRSEDRDNSDQIEISDARNELQANSEEAFHKDLIIT